MLHLVLEDDGTLDTLIEATCQECWDVTLHRLVHPDGVERGADGEITDEAWGNLRRHLEAEHYC